MSPRTSRILLGSALLLTLGAAWFAPEDEAAEAAVSEPAPARSVKNRSVAAPPAVEVLQIYPRALEDADDEQLFGSTQWSAPAAPVATPAVTPGTQPAAPEQAPPLPFRVLGSHEQGGQLTVFLQQNDRNHVVRAGDMIDDVYKVESLDGNVLKLRYLPLDQIQTLDLGRTLNEK